MHLYIEGVDAKDLHGILYIEGVDATDLLILLILYRGTDYYLSVMRVTYGSHSLVSFVGHACAVLFVFWLYWICVEL